MKVLIVSDAPLCDSNSVGNTYANWFSGMPDMEFASIYTRASMPDCDFCACYYQVHAGMVVKKWFAPEHIGRVISWEQLGCKDEQTISDGTKAERKLIRFVNLFGVKKIAYMLEDYIFASGRWINSRFKQFVLDYDPDIVMAFIRPSLRGEMIIKEVQRLKPECKFVGFLADDVHGAVEDGNDKRSKKAREMIEGQLKRADHLYGASEEMCAAYSKKFNVHLEPLYKGCMFEEIIPKVTKGDLRLVYAGNLFYGRDETLANLVTHIKHHNERSVRKMMLEIYTASVVEPEMQKRLNVTGASKLCGAKKYSEIKEILRTADAVLHVESFIPEMIKVVRYSFSTKIMDCLQSGSVLAVIGPKGISSVEYAKKIPGSIVVDDLDDLHFVVDSLLGPELDKRAASIRSYAQNHHSICKIQRGLLADFMKLAAD